jgi:hypothetical protein
MRIGGCNNDWRPGDVVGDAPLAGSGFGDPHAEQLASLPLRRLWTAKTEIHCLL